MEQLNCKISSIVFSNKQTGFCILKAVPEGKSSMITVRGNFPGVSMNIGLKATFTGEFVEHAKFGRQLQASSCEIKPEKGKNGVVSYLLSCVPSIGPITASKLYGHFGDELLTILETDIEKVRDLKFLTKTQIEAIIDEWSESSETRTSSVFLRDLGLNFNQIKLIYTAFRADTKKEVTDDPYSICEFRGIGFITADQIARKLNVGVDDLRRVRALILAALRDLSSIEGHSCATSDQIKNYINRMFKRQGIESFSHGDYVSDVAFYPSLIELEASEEIHSYNGFLYLMSNWQYESEIAKYISAIVNNTPRNLGDFDSILSEFEKLKNLELSEDQKKAFSLLKDGRICVISGYPGTGKTLLMSAFVHLFEKNNIDYTLLAPTGIAAKRLSQLTGKSAYTIHRALGCDREGNWEFNSSNKYIVDAIVLDESSMVDNQTFYHLISSISDTTIVVLVGDAAQLPSVGSGQVLKSFLNSPKVPHVSLTRIYRQEHQSGIIDIAHKILNEELVNTKFDEKNEFLFLNFNIDEVVDEIKKMTSVMLVKNSNFQVISPVYDGELGVDNLNIKLRSVLNPGYENLSKLKHGTTGLYEGDRIMIIKNDYGRMIFNGDVGKVHRISIKSDEVEVKIFNWFDQESKVSRYVDKIFTFTIEEARYIMKVAYACTAHRAQGQEFDYVLMPMTMAYGPMLYKNLIYTAITRARKKVFIFGDPKAFRFAIQNNREMDRNTNLKNLIEDSLSV
jgi:exodeoxyribonuclease V alpha subunit